MILTDLKEYLRERRQAPLMDLVYRFDVEPEALRGMLAHWIRKGNVRRQVGAGVCSTGCGKCDPEALEIYEWVAPAFGSEQGVGAEPRL
ncbi:MAG: FeoC-like transcriptional regulator [Gammaproteobacteria bacterium]